MGWCVVAECVGIVGQPTIVRLMPGLRPARTSVLAFLFLVCGRRLGRSPRRFIRSLQLQHQINQFVLAQALQISPFHARMDSEIALRGKGVGKYLRRRSQKDAMTWERIGKIADEFLPKPRITHPWADKRFVVKHPRWEPYA